MLLDPRLDLEVVVCTVLAKQNHSGSVGIWSSIELQLQIRLVKDKPMNSSNLTLMLND